MVKPNFNKLVFLSTLENRAGDLLSEPVGDEGTLLNIAILSLTDNFGTSLSMTTSQD